MNDKIDKEIEQSYNVSITRKSGEPFGFDLNNLKLEENALNTLRRYEKIIFTRIIEELLKNVEQEEFINIIKSDEVYNFVIFLNFTDFEFNKDYYKKWKLKNKIDNF